MARRTTRAYAPSPVRIADLSNVIAHGLDDVRTNRLLAKQDELEWLRSHGTAFDLYVVAYRVDDLTPGAYRYDFIDHTLQLVRPGDLRSEMSAILVGMRAPETAAFTLILAADFAQYQWRYRHERALRHLYMSAGRSGQRLLVAAQAYGLGTLPTPATRDAATCDLLRLDPRVSTPLYTLTMGPLKGESS
jgi:SagB-type dehydrogenase family enzyme